MFYNDALIDCIIDHVDSALARLSGSILKRLQSVMNAAARDSTCSAFRSGLTLSWVCSLFTNPLHCHKFLIEILS